MIGSISELVIKEIKTSTLLAAITAPVFYLFWGAYVFFSFCIGFVMGCINFAVLVYGISLMIRLKPKMAFGIHFTAFILRYGLTGFVFFELIEHKDANPFVLALGFIMTYFSITMVGLRKSKGVRKEKKDGRG